VQARNNEVESKSKLLQAQLHVQTDVTGNLESDRKHNKEKIDSLHKIIYNHEEAILKLNGGIQEERRDNEQNKNKLSLVLVQLEDFKRRNLTVCNENVALKEKIIEQQT